jgi:RNA polymerase sigma-70 factor, ECF subfamily
MSVNEIECKVSRCAESDNYAALVHLFEQRRGRLVRAALGVMRNQEDAEDVVQEAALRAFVKLNSFRGESQIGTWIYTIIRHSAINRLRNPYRRHELPFDNAMTDHEEVFSRIPAGTNDSPEQSCMHHEFREIVRSEIEGLKCLYRAPIRMCYLEGLSYLDAAEALDMKLPKFKARLHRGRRILLRRLRERLLAARN